ncbi:type I secretion system permease/ATPase [Thalassospira sp.]|uniref:type I secretion system permease/ATPase n=1 Tax=Thalassospira sp. TaxID=1912094 RepID=UPI0027369286|nr:type I secretion system permease/ATPase [Thalassospira sp.]MDP2699344.1 type I secretion system permease/ATPase [Thalassospira sp.]
MSHQGRSSRQKSREQGVLAQALRAVRGAFLSVGVLSGIANLLMLTGPLFMLQVYDRVLASRSLPTLTALIVLVAVLYVFLGAVDALRARMLVRIGWRVDEQLGANALAATLDQALKPGGETARPLHDLDQIRQFLGGAGPMAICDMPWMPLFVGIIFAFHPWLGVMALAGGVILVVLTLISEMATRKQVEAMNGQAARRSTLIEAGRRNAEAIRAMGMTGAFTRRWAQLHQDYLTDNNRVGDVNSTFTAYIKVIRLAMQSGVLALGAWLAIMQEVSPGAMIAASILTARALAPVEQAIGNWRGFIAARQSHHRLEKILGVAARKDDPMPLPAPVQKLEVANLAVRAPGVSGGQNNGRILVRIADVRLRAGDGLGVIGPSGSGKSTFGRALVGIGSLQSGTIRLDGAELHHWDPDRLGRHIGYLPQDVELFDDSVAANIARLDPDAPADAVVDAARQAGVHDMILGLPDGYDTRIGVGGATLSGGQRQRIGLARALYGDPFLIVLDEPNASLDAEGEHALTHAIAGARRRGAIVVLIAHRPAVLAAVNLAMVIQDGRQVALGARDDILRKTMRPLEESA